MEWLLDYYNYRIVGQYLDQLAYGFGQTLFAAGLSLILSITIGLVLALMRLSKHGIFWRPVSAYIEFIRATPLLVQIYIIYYGLPSLFPSTARWNELWPGIIALSLHTAAYMAEIIRAGIVSVPKGQIEGAKSVGMTYTQRLRYIILPQAFANVLPPLLGQTAVLVKDTSLLSIITVFEIMSAGLLINSERVKPNESFLTIAACYLVIYVALLGLSHLIKTYLAGPAWNAKR
ncbi:amino acid ABC transporter permease [Microvirga sp. W0021]|uniref:Amino acid ABC transporter permease n=1 Tax=Hohaiivirga grylli TaxID=3133970 RepID=A0ABV0BKJ2_9HYPH